MRFSLIFISFLIWAPIALFPQESSYSVFNTHRGSSWHAYKHNREALYQLISQEAYSYLDQRSRAVAKIQDLEEWRSYQQEIREKLFESLDAFQRTPLNPRVLGKLERENFTVEKIIFESHPEFYVTACLYIPKGLTQPTPAIIYCSGHTSNGFRAETYQGVILNLVAKGFIVFAFDPIGQGERSQYVDSTHRPVIGLGTREHSYMGMQSLIAGRSNTDYFIWDGSRAVDFLLTREEVDSTRIGITGRSGGGTQSAMIAAYDERIYAAAPEAWISNFTRLFQSIGPQDAEQNPYQIIQKGIDYPDYVHIRAPKPTLIVTTTHDFFSIQGARETYREALRSYEAFGKPDALQLVEHMGKHESTQGNREAMYAFFQTHLDLPGDPTEQAVELFTPEELQITPTGQVMTSFPGKTGFDLNQEYFSRESLPESLLREKIQEVAGISFDRTLTAAVYTGKIEQEEFEAEKYFLENDQQDYALPVYRISHPELEASKTLVWLSPWRQDSLLKHPTLPDILTAGYTIISADLPGIGELHDPEFTGDGFVDGVPNNYVFGAQMVGKSIAGIQAEAIDLLMQFVQERQGAVAPDALVQGTLSSAFLHYTALKNPFEKIVLVDRIASGQALLETRYYDPAQVFSTVPGALQWYQVEDLVKLSGGDSVQVISTLSPQRFGNADAVDWGEVLRVLEEE